MCEIVNECVCVCVLVYTYFCTYILRLFIFVHILEIANSFDVAIAVDFFLISMGFVFVDFL